MWYKLIFYVPSTHCEQVKEALFKMGAGRTAHYDQCCWQTLGEGQFRPLADSQAFIGKPGQLEKVAEFKVEMICEKLYLKAVIQTLLTTHPYEQVAYAIHPILTLEDF
jgi:hypothetical protein